MYMLNTSIYSFMIILLLQLEALVSTLSEAVDEGNEVDQTKANFNVISNTLANITSFITESNVMINETVSSYGFSLLIF